MAVEISDLWPEVVAEIEELDYAKTRYSNALCIELFSEEMDQSTRVILSKSLLRYSFINNP